MGGGGTCGGHFEVHWRGARGRDWVAVEGHWEEGRDVLGDKGTHHFKQQVLNYFKNFICHKNIPFTTLQEKVSLQTTSRKEEINVINDLF